MFNFEFGAVNSFLRSVGLAPVDVYSNKNAWPVILIVVSAFKNVGYGTVMYLASIVNIDGQLFEAADLDGATMWQKIWHITLPCIRPTIAILFLLAIGTIMKGDFQMFWQVTGNNPMVLEVTDVIDTYVTRSLLHLQEFGMTSAAGPVPVRPAPSLLVLAGQLQLVKKGGAGLRAVLRQRLPEKRRPCPWRAQDQNRAKSPVGRDRVACSTCSPVAVLTALSRGVPAAVPAGAQRLRVRAVFHPAARLPALPGNHLAGRIQNAVPHSGKSCCGPMALRFLCTAVGTVLGLLAHQHGGVRAVQPRFQVPLPGVVFLLLHLYFRRRIGAVVHF